MTEEKISEQIRTDIKNLDVCRDTADQAKANMKKALKDFPELADPALSSQQLKDGIGEWGAEVFVACLSDQKAPAELSAAVKEQAACLDAAKDSEKALKSTLKSNPAEMQALLKDRADELGNLSSQDAIRKIAVETAKKCITR